MSILSDYEEIRKQIGEETYNKIGKFLENHHQYTLADVYYRKTVWDEMENWEGENEIL